MVQRGERPISVRPRQFGYPSPFRGQGHGTQGSLPCFPSMALSSRRPPFLRWVPVSPVPRLQRYYEGATTSGPCIPGSLWIRFRAPQLPPSFVLAKALPARWRTTPSLGSLVSRSPRLRLLACGHALDLSGFPAIRPMPLPGSQTPAEPPEPHLSRSRRCCPRIQHAEGSSAYMISRLNPGLQHPRPTLHEWRHRYPRQARFRLAGCAFAGRETNPLDRCERFPVTSLPPSQDFS